MSALWSPNRIALRGPRRRAAAMYAAVLLIAMLLTGAGITLISTQMADRRMQRNVTRSEQAELLAQSGIEWILWSLNTDPTWRKTVTDGDTFTLNLTDLGSVTTMVTDDDGNLGDNEGDPVNLTALGAADGAQQALTAIATPRPHPALAFAVMGDGDVSFGSSVTAAGPVRSNGNIIAYSTVTLEDNVSFETDVSSSIDPSLVPASYTAGEISFPTPDLSFYTSQATMLYEGGSQFDLYDDNLTPTDNTLGSVNPKGIYWIDAGNRNVVIRWTHVKGTLIITNVYQYVWFAEPCWLEPGPLGYPTLLIDDSGAEVWIELPGHGLDEWGGGVDYNEDGDTSDVFSDSIEGLVWSNSPELWLTSWWDMTGCVIGKEIHIDNGVHIDDNPELQNRMIPGFIDQRLRLVRGSVREIEP